MNLVCLKGRPKGSYVYIGRGGPLGNPFSHLPPGSTRAQVQVPTVEDAVACCDAWARGSTAWDHVVPPSQRGRFLAAVDALKDDYTLGCYCPVGSPCHGLVIMRLWAERRNAAGGGASEEER
jgi:hypothetical protein